jgi:hypothetical protein
MKLTGIKPASIPFPTLTVSAVTIIGNRTVNPPAATSVIGQAAFCGSPIMREGFITSTGPLPTPIS